MGQIITTQNLVATKVVRHAGQLGSHWLLLLGNDLVFYHATQIIRQDCSYAPISINIMYIYIARINHVWFSGMKIGGMHSKWH